MHKYKWWTVACVLHFLPVDDPMETLTQIVNGAWKTCIQALHPERRSWFYRARKIEIRPSIHLSIVRVTIVSVHGAGISFKV